MGQDTQTEQEKQISPSQRERTSAEAAPFWLDLLHALVWSAVLVALCFTFFVRIICVDGISMEPALRQNDRVLVLSTLWRAPQNGDVVVFRKDSFLSEAVIKRVIATEGQTVDIDFDTGAVTVDGVVLDEPYIKDLTLTAGDVAFPFTVSPGCVFVLGDNRNASTDSRQSVLGELDRRYLLGQAVCILIPGPDETGRTDWSRIGGVK